MTNFPQRPSFPHNPSGATSPRNPREAADAIMAYLDREAAGATMSRAPFAPFLSETYAPPAIGGESDDAPAAASFDTPYRFHPFGSEGEGEGEDELPLPFPDAQSDDERIENVMWLLENNRAVSQTQPEASSAFQIENLFGLIGSAEAASGGQKPGGKFDLLKVAEAARNSIRNGALRQLFRLWRSRLREIEPFHPLLARDPSEDHVPSQEELDALEHAHRAAEHRATLRKALKARRVGGETVHTIRGRASHKLFDVDTKARGGFSEVRVPKGRIDRVLVNAEMNTADAIDLKPKNSPTVRKHERQAERNATSYEEKHGRRTSWGLDFYDVEAVVDWLRGNPGKK